LYLFTKKGVELNIWYDKKVKKWLEMKYRLGVSSDYLSQIAVTGLLDGLFISKIRISKILVLYTEDFSKAILLHNLLNHITNKISY
jgi:hypothetical protein